MTKNDLCTEAFLRSILYIRMLLSDQDVEGLLDLFEDPKAFESFPALLFYTFESDNYLLLDEKVVHTVYDFISKYRFAHKSPGISEICNTCIVDLNASFAKLSEIDRQETKEQCFSQQLYDRGIWRVNEQVPFSIMKDFTCRDFWTQIILSDCAILVSEREKLTNSKEEALEWFEQVPLLKLRVEGLGKETYDDITSVRFLTSINFLLGHYPEFFQFNPEWVDVAQILVKKAFIEHQTKISRKTELIESDEQFLEQSPEVEEDQEEYSREEEQFLTKIEEKYDLISRQTQKQINEFQYQQFGKRKLNPLIQKAKKLFKSISDNSYNNGKKKV